MCLLLVALLAGIAAVCLRSGRGGAGLDGAIVELQSADRVMRDRARRNGQAGELVFDLNQGAVWRVESHDQDHTRRVPLEAFGETTRIRAVRATVGDVEDGQYVIPCRDGRTPTYAVLVASESRQQWLIVPGLTGAFEKAKDEAEVAKIFSDLSLATAGDDAR